MKFERGMHAKMSTVLILTKVIKHVCRGDHTQSFPSEKSYHDN
jgi:hypothetical protein